MHIVIERSFQLTYWCLSATFSETLHSFLAGAKVAQYAGSNLHQKIVGHPEYGNVKFRPH